MPDESVKVVVRVRPLSRKEQQDGHLATTVADEDQGTITCNNPKSDIADPPKVFTFDAVFASGCNQKSIYDKCGATVVEAYLMVTMEQSLPMVRQVQVRPLPWKVYQNPRVAWHYPKCISTYLRQGGARRGATALSSARIIPRDLQRRDTRLVVFITCRLLIFKIVYFILKWLCVIASKTQVQGTKK